MRHYKEKNCQYFIAVLSAVFFVSVSSLLSVAQLQAAAITGTVGNASGGLAEQWVDVFDCTTASPGYKLEEGYIKSGKTGAGGAYSIDVAPGQYRIAVLLGTAYDDYWYKDKASPGAAECVTVPEEGKVLDSIVLTPADNSGSISGTVSKVGGGAIPGVIVYAHAINGYDVLTTTTNDVGFYKIQTLQPGKYAVYFGAGTTGYVSAWHDANADNIPDEVAVTSATEIPNINVALEEGGTISGKVTFGSPTGSGIANAWVDVCESGSTVCNSSSATWRGYAKTSSSPDDGVYTVKGLPTGKKYIVQFHGKTVQNAGAGVTQFYDKQQGIGLATEVAVNSAGINAVFTGATIAGKVTGSDGGIANVIVNAYDSNGNLAAASAPTLADGAYVIKDLAQGSYKLHFDASATDYVSKWYQGSDMESAVPVLIASPLDAMTDKNVALAVPAAALAPMYNLLLFKKRCADANGTPVYCNCVVDGVQSYCN